MYIKVYQDTCTELYFLMINVRLFWYPSTNCKKLYGQFKKKTVTIWIKISIITWCFKKSFLSLIILWWMCIGLYDFSLNWQSEPMVPLIYIESQELFECFTSHNLYLLNNAIHAIIIECRRDFWCQTDCTCLSFQILLRR